MFTFTKKPESDHETAEKFRGILEGVLDGILLADAETKKFTFSNPIICQMLGYTPEEITKLGVQDIHPTQELPHIVEQFEKQLRGEIELATDIPVKRKDGSIFYADIKSSPVQFGSKTYLVGMFRDVTELRTTKESLRMTNMSLAKAQQIAQVGSWELDITKNELIWSDEAYRIFEIPIGSTLTYEDFLSTIHPDDIALVDTSWESALHGKPYDIEHRIIINHKPKWVRERAELQFDEHGNATKGTGTVQDISERKQMEEALRKSEIMFKTMVNWTHDWEYWVDPDNNLIYMTPSVKEITGYPAEEFIKNPQLMIDIVHPEDRIIFMEHRQGVHNQPADTRKLEFRIVTRSGAGRWVEHLCRPIYDDKLEYLGRRSGNRDITEYKKNEEILHTRDEELRLANIKLRDEKAKDEALLASIGEGMIATDNTGEIIAVNRIAEQILGWNKEDLIGKKAGQVIPVIDENGELVPPEKHAVAVAIATSTTISSNTMQYVHKEGGRRTPVAVTVNPVILEGKLIGSIAIFRDITKEKELEETRRDLLSLASHQLRTPLSGTKWLIETLIKGIHGPLTKEQKEYLDEIYKINERMTTLVHDMLSVLRMESGITAATKEQVSVVPLAHTTIDGLDAVAKNKNIALRLSECEDCDIAVDPLLLQNVLEGLISNAINYSNPGSEVVVNIEKKPTELIFSVKDSGIGIPQDEQRQIFARFYRASNAKTFDTRGTGLGLYIASMLAKKIGAILSFESEEGKGSTFYIHIPFAATNDMPSLS